MDSHERKRVVAPKPWPVLAWVIVCIKADENAGGNASRVPSRGPWSTAFDYLAAEPTGNLGFQKIAVKEKLHAIVEALCSEGTTFCRDPEEGHCKARRRIIRIRMLIAATSA